MPTAPRSSARKQVVMRIRPNVVVLLIVALVIGASSAASALDGEGSFGVVDTATGEWYLLDLGTLETTKFYYGVPGDLPFVGDWDCDGDETPGLYRQSSGFVYLRNSNDQGIADTSFFFGNPGDIPIAGDFDGDTCDTVSIYRPSEGKVYVINELGANGGSLGPAEFSYFFGNPGDKPFVGDFDTDGIDSIGLHRESSGFVYFRNSHTTGIADNSFFFGNPGDKMFAANWLWEPGPETVGLYRPSDCTMYLRHSNTQGVADEFAEYGRPAGVPVAGDFGELTGGSLPPFECPPTRPAVPVTFQNGLYHVGEDVQPGTYRGMHRVSGPCAATRFSSLAGNGTIIASARLQGPLIVTIDDTDAGFGSWGCEVWTNDLSPITSSPTASFREGYYFVPWDVAPGTWRNSAPTDLCTWQHLAGFSWEEVDVIDGGTASQVVTIEILPTDEGFFSSDCGTWTYLGQEALITPTAERNAAGR